MGHNDPSERLHRLVDDWGGQPLSATDPLETAQNRRNACVLAAVRATFLLTATDLRELVADLVRTDLREIIREELARTAAQP